MIVTVTDVSKASVPDASVQGPGGVIAIIGDAKTGPDEFGQAPHPRRRQGRMGDRAQVETGV